MLMIFFVFLEPFIITADVRLVNAIAEPKPIIVLLVHPGLLASLEPLEKMDILVMPESLETVESL